MGLYKMDAREKKDGKYLNDITEIVMVLFH